MKTPVRFNRSTNFVNYLSSSSGEFVFNKDLPTSLVGSNVTYVVNRPPVSVVSTKVSRAQIKRASKIELKQTTR